ERTTQKLADQLGEAATAFAREALRIWQLSVPRSPATVQSAYLDERRVRGAYRADSPSCRRCGKPLIGRERVWCAVCRRLPGRGRKLLGGRRRDARTKKKAAIARPRSTARSP